MLLRKIFSFATLTLLVAITLSSIAAWYSIQGLMAIFAAAVVPIMIMGGSLEFAKVVTTVWLHRYWDRAGWKLKLYLIPAVVALAFLTSMGIFGFLSKAHSDQSLVSGDVGAKVAIYDEKIKTARDNIDANRKALQQMDAQVDQLLGRTTDDKGANRAVQVRRQQKAERTRLQNEISAEQEVITKLQDESAPIRAQVRKVEAEVGPIKYIAAMIYGDNPDSNLLEKAVRWVIILIVFVFDPLALTLVLAAQSSYKWLDDDLRNRKKEEEDEEKFKEAFLNTKLDKDASKLLDEVTTDNQPEQVHDKCGTPECCGECDTAVDQEFLDRLNAAKTPAIVEEVQNADEHIQSTSTEPDGETGSIPLEVHIPIDDEHNGELEQEEERVEGTTREEPVINTEGVTLHQDEGGYIQFEGKSMSKEALKGMRPELFAQPDMGHQSTTKFGTEFPRFATKGDFFVRVDTLPNRVFKFDGYKWIEVNKEVSNSYLYDEEYIRYLVAKIETGEYDIDLLSESEKEQIEDYLARNQK